MEDVLLTWIRESRHRHFLLIIAGRLSGVHGWKRTHIPQAYQVIDSTIIIHFDDSEHLTVSNPESVFYASNGDLFMKNALRVRITWCSEKDPDKDCEEMFGKFGRLIYVNRKDDLYSTGTGFLGQLDTHLRICP